MEKLIPIKIPLLNPNEPEALLASLEVQDGAPVKAGDVLALIETTKSTGEITAEADGYLVGIRFREGETLNAGEVLAYIGDTPDASDPALSPWNTEEETRKGETAPTGKLVLMWVFAFLGGIIGIVLASSVINGKNADGSPKYIKKNRIQANAALVVAICMIIIYFALSVIK